MKAAFYTLGCKVNQYESQSMSELLKKSGIETVGLDAGADIFIVNSCTVTAESDAKTRRAVRKLRRENPGALIVLTGCMPQAYPGAAAELREADIIMGNANNADIAGLIESYTLTGRRGAFVRGHVPGEAFAPAEISRFDGHTRAFVKIEDGCDRFCSYCIIPRARGRVRSRPPGDMTAELRRLAGAGYIEAVLVGINLSAYGRDCGLSLCDAVESACAVPGIKRVRLGSLEPDELTGGVIDRLAKLPALCPHFHISLQSGCDETLKRMNRRYDSDGYSRICEKIRSAFKNASITTDIMVGFPGETDAEFEQSLRFAMAMRFEKAHIFAYSRREGTAAAGMENQVSRGVKSERSKIMIAEAEAIRHECLKEQTGNVHQVLFESKNTGRVYEGYTESYLPVKASSERDVRGGLFDVKITGTDGDCCVGEIK